MDFHLIILFSISSYSLLFFGFHVFTGTKKMEYKTRQWHEKCFSCCVCKNPIGTKSYVAIFHYYLLPLLVQPLSLLCCFTHSIGFAIHTHTLIYVLYYFSFIPKEQEIYCAGCYEEKYATRCIKCSKV